ncbi:MAG: PH domain-containing protein [Clostridia bacterium]|nr:PH domain-containing protein [Clostridia bacterium]
MKFTTSFSYKPTRDIISLIIGLIWKIIFVVVMNAFFLTMVEEMSDVPGIATIAQWGNFFIIALTVSFFVGDLVNIYSQTHTRLIINSNEIVYKTGWLNKSVTTIPAYKIRSCTKRSGWLQRLCGSMNISVTTAGDSDEIYFYNIANGDEAYRLISELAKKECTYY